MKVQMKCKGVREEKMDRKGENLGEGGATLLLECLWFYNTKGSGSTKGGGRGRDQPATNHKKIFLVDRSMNRIGGLK